MLDTISIYSDGTLVSTRRSPCLSLCLCPVRSKVCVPVVSIIEAARDQIILAKFNLKIIVLLSDICCSCSDWRIPELLAQSRGISPCYPPGTRQRQDGYLILIFLMADNQAVAGVGAGGVITTVMAWNSSSQTTNCIKINIRYLEDRMAQTWSITQ